jgi:iron complex outermembrane receptor protein
MSQISTRHILASAASGAVLLFAAGAHAAAASNEPATASAGAEGTEVSDVVVTAERSQAAATAPAKASIDETQPESIITHQFIEQATPETGGWVSVAGIAPSVSGVTSNGVGDTAKLTMRGFQDGQFNLTYDGIAFGDTNGPTHHESDYFPAQTIGAVVIDRGPGAAGDLGQANFGGAIHYFSPTVSDTFSGSQKVTIGSFNTYQTVTSLNTGTLPQLAGGKLLVILSGLTSDGELSHSSGWAWNGTAKYVLPLSDKGTFTAFSSINSTRFYLNDGSGPGATWSQVLAYGKNFALSDVPGDEHYYKDNYEYKQTDMEYGDLKYQFTNEFSAEDQFYTYFYSNKTKSVSCNTDLVGTGNACSVVGANADKGGETGQLATDLQGYDKLNQYRVYGNIVRLNQDFGFGTLKVGALVEWSDTGRHNLIRDITAGWSPDFSIKAASVTNGKAVANATSNKLQELSHWQDYQVFADFNWRPMDNLTISPGFKFVYEHLSEQAVDEKVAQASGSLTEPYAVSNNYHSPLYFLTVNYKFRPDWSIYGQVATSFVFPFLGELDFSGAQSQNLEPEKTISYQLGTVYSHGDFTFDADVYEVAASNLEVNCTVIDDGTPEAAQCNAGKARYSGIEGEAAYHFDMGLTLFANAGSNVSKQLGGGGQAAGNLPNAPRWTEAVGGVYNHGPWAATLTYKQSGTYTASLGSSLSLPGYDSLDGSVAYDFGHFRIKADVFNLLDKRAITNFTGSTLFSKTDTGYYQFQEGRDFQLTLQAKF